MPTWQRIAPYAFLAAAVFLVYSNIYDNVFLFDDDLLIRLNSYLRSWNTFDQLLSASTTGGAHIAGGFYRPIQNILYFFCYQLGGEKPFYFHLLNVLLHAANACLGYRLALRLGFDPRAALFAMLVWALHPLHTEAVTYMSGTADPLFVMFCLWGLNILFPNPTFKRILCTLPVFALALLSKETAVVFPALVVVCLYYISPEKLKLRTYAITWPLWIITIAYLAWRVDSTEFDGPARYVELMKMPAYATMKYYAEHPHIRFMTFLATLPSYAQLLVWPTGLHMERTFSLYDDPTTWPVIIGTIMLLAALVQITRNKKPSMQPLNWGLLWFGAAHAPNSGVLFSMNSLFLEHWMYLPTIGLFLGLAQSAVPLINRMKRSDERYALFAFAMIAVTILSARTFDQNKLWREPIVFYTNIFSHGVKSPRAHNNLAIAYMENHDIQGSIAEYRKAISEGDTYAETHYNLAICLMSLPNQKEQIPQVIAELERSIEIEPGFYRSYQALSELYGQTGDKAKAEAYRQKAERILGH